VKTQSRSGVVFDCNVLLQAAARRTSPAAACLRLAEEDFICLYLSEDILTELADVLSRPKVRARFPELTDEIVNEFLDQLRSTAEIVKHVPKVFTYKRDADDEPYINLAVEAGADYLVSRDNDLLDLMTGYTDECKEFRQRFRPLKVIEPVAFLKEIEKSKSEIDST
jgi:putative PIN family toxin of toxin-antitoxin system